MKTLICISLLSLLVSCSTTPTAILTPTDRTVHIDARILELCGPLEKVIVGASFDEALTVTIRNYELYRVCADKQKASVELLKEFSNTKGK